MLNLITSIFGDYTPVTYYQGIVVDGVLEEYEVVADGLAGVDWPWVAGVFLFSITLYSFFRLVGVVLRG